MANLGQATDQQLLHLYFKYSKGLEKVEAELRARRWCPPLRVAGAPPRWPRCRPRFLESGQSGRRSTAEVCVAVCVRRAGSALGFAVITIMMVEH